MFGSGTLGDRFDYYTADHRDTAHPRPAMPDTRSRAEAEGRGPKAQAPEYTEITAIAAAATILEFSRQMETEATVIETTSAVAQAIKKIVGLLRAGHQIAARSERNEPMIEELTDMSEQYEQARAAITDSFRNMDRDVTEVEDPVKRVALQRQTAELRRNAAILLPDDSELQSYASGERNESYVGFQAQGGGADADVFRHEANEKANRMTSAFSRSAMLPITPRSGRR